jgi:hypothetical protein
MYARTYVCICVCICMCVCIYIYIYMCVYMYVCMCVCVCMYIIIYIYINTSIRLVATHLLIGSINQSQFYLNSSTNSLMPSNAFSNGKID